MVSQPMMVPILKPWVADPNDPLTPQPLGEYEGLNYGWGAEDPNEVQGKVYWALKSHLLEAMGPSSRS